MIARTSPRASAGWSVSTPAYGPALRGILLAVAASFLLPVALDAQYFGRNKVQYDDFDFRVMSTPHFDIHFYPEKEEALEDVARMAERWYERLARLFQHEFEASKPLIFYADHPDFQQTNTIGGHIGEGTGGVTEGLKDRVVMPLAGTYAGTDHVLGHELVHAFQFNIAQSRRGGGLQALMRLPLWFVEGMAEYLSVGNEDPLTGMWLRDAVLRDDLPTAGQMTRNARFFPYRFGQAFWTHVGGTYGDEAVVRLFRAALRVGWESALKQVLGMSSDSISARWHEELEDHFRPLMEGRTPPGEAGTLLLAPSTGAGHQNLAPSLSPDGRYLAFISEKDVFGFDLYLADARTGEIIRKLASSASDPHFDALRFIDSSGAWSPDGKSLAVSVFAGGRNELVVFDVSSGRVRDRISVDRGVGEISSPSWSPDGGRIVFSGQMGGLTDLFLLDLETRELKRLTDDKHGDYQPTFSPDGRMIAFASDRGTQTDFELLTYSEMQLSLLDLESGAVEALELLGNVRHSNPQFSPDGRSLYFLSDHDGFSDIYRVGLGGREIRRVTNLATAVSGITQMAPAMSVARETGTVVFSVFDDFQFHVYSVDSREALAEEEAVVAAANEGPGRFIPPTERRVHSRVASYLNDPRTGLAELGQYSVQDASGYSPTLELDYVGQPSVGAGTDQFGNFVSGSAAAYFSDMLGNRSLGVALQAQGTVKDIGGQAFYQNRENRWNWGVGGGRIPFMAMRTGAIRDPSTGNTLFVQDRQRIFLTQTQGLLSYPFSTTRRLDLGVTVSRYSFDLERELLEFDALGRLVSHDRERMNDLVPDPLNLFETSAALVGDNSYFGFTSPVRGQRYRLEVRNTVGNLDYKTVTADFRRYFNPRPELTFAVRGLHLGRYGEEDLHDSVIQPFFLGWETFIRGYAPQSFQMSECRSGPAGGSQCPQFERLFGHRIAAANAEVRVPLIGTERFGLLDIGFLPTEIVAFADAGLAWDEEHPPELTLSYTDASRVPVFSTGLSTRLNLMGFLVMEIYYAVPWQRPEKGGHFGFHVAPGW